MQIELGRLDGRLVHPVPCGSEVDVLLRPDDVVHDDDGALTATVAHKAFRGADILYTLRLDSGATILSLVSSHHDHRLGERIGIRLAADHIVAFPRQQARASTVSDVPAGPGTGAHRSMP